MDDIIIKVLQIIAYSLSIIFNGYKIIKAIMDSKNKED